MIYYLIGVVLFIFMLEQLVFGWKLFKVSIWVVWVIFFNIVQVLIVLFVGIIWNKWMMGYSLLYILDVLLLLLVGFVVYFVNIFVIYWWYCVCYVNDMFWWLFYQLYYVL